MPCCSSSCVQHCKSCVDCTCGDDCRCTETLCRCEASSVLNSLLPAPSSAVATLRVGGMTCQACVQTVAAVCHVDPTHVDIASGMVKCQVESQQEALQMIKDLHDVGFDATLEEMTSGENNTSLCSTPCSKRPSVASKRPLSSSLNRKEQATTNSKSPLFDNVPSPSTFHDPLLDNEQQLLPISQPPPQERNVGNGHWRHDVYHVLQRHYHCVAIHTRRFGRGRQSHHSCGHHSLSIARNKSRNITRNGGNCWIYRGGNCQ